MNENVSFWIETSRDPKISRRIEIHGYLRADGILSVRFTPESAKEFARHGLLDVILEQARALYRQCDWLEVNIVLGESTEVMEWKPSA